MADNIDTSAGVPPRWDAADPAASLQSLREYAENQVRRAIRWYYERKEIKARWSWGLRFFTVLFSGIGALCPITEAVWPTIWGVAPSKLGYIFIASAAIFVAFDRFTGSSSGWMRYIAAAIKLETLLEQFRLQWVRLNAERGDNPLDTTSVKPFLDQIEAFSTAARAEVEKETQAWISEFQSNLGQLEKEAKEALADLRTEARKEAEAVEGERLAKAESQKHGPSI